MSEMQGTDIQRLQQALGMSGELSYVDFTEREALEQALQRWPVLARLLYARQLSAGLERDEHPA